MVNGVVVATCLFGFGMAGAWAFNPDDGAIAHVEILWRLFGVGAYLGLLLGYLIPLGFAIAAAVGGFSRGRARCRGG